MKLKEISAKDLRERQAYVLNQIVFKGVNFIITRHGKKAAVLIPLEEFQLLQKTMEYLEDESDLADAKAAIKEAKALGATPLLQFAKEIGVDC